MAVGLLVAGTGRAVEDGDAGSGVREVEVFSLSKEFSPSVNDVGTPWSFQVGNPEVSPSELRFLPVADRDANQLWGSDFAAPPRMWADAQGYWGVGRNDSGVPQVSTRNDTTWQPGEVLLHPKGGDAPTCLVVGWTAPRVLALDLRYAFGLAAQGSSGVGLKVLRWTPAGSQQLVALSNIGRGITNQLHGLVVRKGDRLLFCIDTAGDPGGDIVRADIRLTARGPESRRSIAVEPSAAEVDAWATLPAGDELLAQAGGRPLDARAVEEYRRRTTMLPSVDVHGVRAGNPSLVRSACRTRGPGRRPDATGYA